MKNRHGIADDYGQTIKYRVVWNDFDLWVDRWYESKNVNVNFVLVICEGNRWLDPSEFLNHYGFDSGVKANLSDHVENCAFRVNDQFERIFKGTGTEIV